MSFRDRRIVEIVNSRLFFRFLQPFWYGLVAHGYSVTVLVPRMTSIDYWIVSCDINDSIGVIEVGPMARQMSPRKDLMAIASIARVLRELRPIAVHTHGAKAGIIGLSAGLLTRVPVRLHQFHGAAWYGRRGARGLLLRIVERVNSRLATDIIAVSASLGREVRKLNGTLRSDSWFPERGINTCVDMDHPVPIEKCPSQTRMENRRRLEIGSEAFVLGFVGRISQEKGIEDLQDVWSRVRRALPNCYLLLVGPNDERDADTVADRKRIGELPGVCDVGAVDSVWPYLACIDVLVLPSRREGLGMVLLEAASMGIPSVAYDVVGVRDVIETEVTGMLVRPFDRVCLAEAIVGYARDPARRTQHGLAAKRMCADRFSREDGVRTLLRIVDRAIEGHAPESR